MYKRFKSPNMMGDFSFINLFVEFCIKYDTILITYERNIKMNKLLAKYRVNKVSQFGKSSEIFNYIINCYSNSRLDLENIQKMIRKSIDKLNKVQIYELLLVIPFDNELRSIANKKMSTSFDRKISVEYILSEDYSASYEEEISLLTYIFSEKNDFDLRAYYNKILSSKRFNNEDVLDKIPTIIKAACNSKKGEVIYNVLKKVRILSDEIINLIIDTLEEINDIKHLYLIIENVKLKEVYIFKIIKFMCNSKEYEYIYKVSLLFPEYKELYRKSLLESSNRYYLILYMIYVDEFLIHMIFSSTEKLIEYMKLYDFELKDIRYACIKYGYNINDIISPKDVVDKNIKTILLKLDCK